MINIRKNTFETNSSSTHCLAFDNKVKYDEKYLKNIKGVITPYQDGDDIQYNQINIYEKLEDKIKWLLSSLRQATYENDDIQDYITRIKNNLKDLCPDLEIDMLPNLDSYYEWEDIEYGWSDWDGEPDLYLLLDKNNLKKFLLESTVIWGDRDYSEYTWGYYIDDTIKNNYNEIWCKWSG